MSIEIIDKIKPKAPIFTFKPAPTIFKTSLDETKYWQEEKRRWIEGQGDLTGMLYYYATQIKLKDRVRGHIFRPTVRDADLIIFNAIEQARKEGLALYFMKARGIGFSSIGMNLPFYFFRTMPNSNCIATSKDKKTLARLFTDKTMVAYEEFDSPYTKPDQIAKNQTANESHLKVGMKYIDDEGKEKYAESIFECRDTQESEKAATNFSGGGAIYGFADEAPLMPRMDTFFNSAIETFKDHSINKIVGTLVMGGTVEATIKPEEIAKIQNIWENHKVKRILPLFLPATYGKHMVNGWSDHKRAEEEILRERDELEKAGDRSKLDAFIKNNPLDISEIFSMAGQASWDEYAIQKINERGQAIPKEPPIALYNITDMGHKAEVSPNQKGNVKILQHPKDNVKYIIGVDGIMTSELTNNNADASDYSICVMKGVDPQDSLQFAPVALYKERPRSIEDANKIGLALLKYYNKYNNAKIIGETNAGGEHLLKMIQNAGLWNTVMYRKDLNKSGWVDTKKAWFYRNQDIKEWQYEAANIYFKKYSEQIKFMEIITDAKKKYEDNKDTLDSFMACLYGWGTGDLLDEKLKKERIIKMMICVGWDSENMKPIYEERIYKK
jgi:hypothetical protein